MGTNSHKYIKQGFFTKTLKDFALGCLAFIPLGVFAFVLFYLFKIGMNITHFIFGITDSRTTSFTIGFLIIIIITYTGRKLRRKEKWFLDIVETFISKIPLIGGWYTTFCDLIQTFTRSNGNNYMGTAKVPCGNGYIIGFVTKKETQKDGKIEVSIFVPTSPNPTTGLVFFYPEEQIEYIDMSPERAFTKIISLGTK